jgi:hypothetical protein
LLLNISRSDRPLSSIFLLILFPTGGSVKASLLLFNVSSISTASSVSLPVRLDDVACCVLMLCSAAHIGLFYSLGRDKGGYYHELFLRSKSFLAHKIPRTKLKNEGARKSTSPESEPNFYLLPYLPEEAPRTSHRMQGVATSSMEEKVSHTRGQLESAVPSSYALGGNVALDRLAQSNNGNSGRPNLLVDQFNNAGFSRYFPSLQSSRLPVTDNSFLFSQLAYQQSLANQYSPSVASLGQHPNLAAAMIDAARLQQLQQQQQQQQRVSNAELANFVNHDDMIALRLAMARGYTSIDDLLRDAAGRRNPN